MNPSFYTSDPFYLIAFHAIILTLWVFAGAVIFSMGTYEVARRMGSGVTRQRKKFIWCAVVLAVLGTFLVPVLMLPRYLHWAIGIYAFLALCFALAYGVYIFILRRKDNVRRRLTGYIFLFLVVALPLHVTLTYNSLATHPISRGESLRAHLGGNAPLYNFFNIRPQCCSDSDDAKTHGAVGGK